jgi:hypothetical protein
LRLIPSARHAIALEAPEPSSDGGGTSAAIHVDGGGVARLTVALASADATLSYRTCQDFVATASTVSPLRLAEPASKPVKRAPTLGRPI